MAGRKLTIKGKAKTSTILEVLISMIIILTVFGIGMMIFGNVSRLSLSAKRIKAESILQERLLNIEQGNIGSVESVTIGYFQVEQEIKQYGESKILSSIHLTAWDSNHEKVAEVQKVIISQ